ncbi:MAG: 2-oxo acid dehydrogenase subunit E2 [Acidimicrobiia bacterium]|nr:2-oxo acid dehydrogenase subunit E2 [Acidimicrobiia bacterium]
MSARRRSPSIRCPWEIDMSAVLEARSSDGGSERPSVTAFLVCAVAAVLRDFPDVNGSYEDGRIKLNDDVNVGVAVGTDSQASSFRSSDVRTTRVSRDVAAELTALRADADAGRPRLDQMTSGTFNHPNLGMHGIDVFTAIVNSARRRRSWPLVASVGRRRDKARSTDHRGGRVWVTLSVDHRAVDGARGARFLSAIKTALEGSSVGQTVVRS